jgi:hypothetical protein
VPFRFLHADLLKTVLAKLIDTSLRKVGAVNHYTTEKPKNNHHLGYTFVPFPYCTVRKLSHVPHCIVFNSKTDLL